ncbi:hypothetical protein [Hymenobacter arizonensis]|uniref:Glycosyltransferase RgtA/B/C/D-like domain-containing protein n=1 Tax=Hymenobacter arizonensis TaxID=1227077 RepID=A0A1I5X641_HYMAR|nr:hypothetical protein [Hymenobacter arizonensis]SFQ27442.1 hypothetical protein SAMN04515668_1667 [Hymenobacter arizonensis]
MQFYRLLDALRAFVAARSGAFYVRCYFAALLLLGLCLYRDYGLSWDEPVDRINGQVSAKYIMGLVAPGWSSTRPGYAITPDIHGFGDNDHGVLFELPLVLLNQISGIDDTRIYYLMRHLAVFLVCCVGTWALFKIGRVRFQKTSIGLAVSTLLLLSPRFFAESFYNGKDLVFVAVFTLGIYTLVRLLRRPSVGRAAVHGLATAAAIDIRVLGVLLVALTIGMLVLEAGFGTGGRPLRWKLAQVVTVYLVVTAVATVAGWPYLWEAPVQNFSAAFLHLSQYAVWKGYALYWGNVIPVKQLPWHYVPVWIFITTPLAYSFAFVLGAASVLFAAIRRPWAYLRHFENRLDLLFHAWFFVPIFMVIGFHSVLYDGWRHLYFVYPALLLLAVRGAQGLWQARHLYRWGRPLAVGAAVLAAGEMVFTVRGMVQAHPQQQVYFSFLPGPAVAQLFERDYWGLSYREGLEWIAQHDTSPQLNVTGQINGLIHNNLTIMKPAVRARFRIGGSGKGQYFLGGYRTQPTPYPDSLGKEVHVVKAFGAEVLSVRYKE